MGKFKGVLIFAGGAIVGSLATYYLVREKFRIQADEEVEQIRQLYLKKDADELAEARKPFRVRSLFSFRRGFR